MTDKLKYRELDDEEHCRRSKSLFLGECNPKEKKLFSFDDDKNKSTVINQGICKLFDELIVNCFDHIRTANIPVGIVYVVFNPENKKLTLINTSKLSVIGKIYGSDDNVIPRVLLKKMKSSSNYDVKKDVGGRHGYGLKLCRMFSDYFSMLVTDDKNTYSYKKIKGNPEIEKILKIPTYNKIINSKEFVKISFIPDKDELMLAENEEIEPFIKFRLAELYTYYKFVEHNILIYYNNVNLDSYFNEPIYKKILPKHMNPKTFKFIYTEIDKKTTHIGKCFFVLEPKQINVKSVNYCILNGIDVESTLMVSIFFKMLKKADLLNVEPTSYFNSFTIISCDGIVFTGQDKLKIDGKIEFDIDIKKEFNQAEFGELVECINNHKINSNANKNKNKIVVSNFKKASVLKNATLALVEGLSAKTAFQRSVDKIPKLRSSYGILAMTGKIFNCIRDPVKGKTNKIILSIAKILNLDFKNPDKALTKYNEILIVPDPDPDGAHIACLIISLFHAYFPKILENIYILDLPRFNCCEQGFFTQEDFEEHIRKSKKKNHKTIYAKGLGSIPASEFDRILKNTSIYKKQILIDSEYSDEIMNHLFGKSSNDRKLLFKNKSIQVLDEHAPISRNKVFNEFNELKKNIESNENFPKNNFFQNIKFRKNPTFGIYLENYIYSKYAEFLIYSNKRSIPELIDGDTIVTRKIKYTFLKNSNTQSRALVFCGKIISDTLYHHGDASLYKTVTKLASSYCCGINVPFIDIEGSTGSRAKLGKDVPQARYISLRINPVSNALYNHIDFEIEPPKIEEGQLIEPHVLLPILPIILINGAEGIGTGFNCYIPPHNIFEVLEWYLKRIDNVIDPVPKPWVRGFTGKIELELKKKNEPKTIITETDLEDPYEIPSENDSLFIEEDLLFNTEEELATSEEIKSPEVIKDSQDSSTSQSSVLDSSKERLLISGNIKDNFITEIPFNISIDNFLTWMQKNEINYDDSNIEMDRPFISLKSEEDIKTVTNKLVCYKGINCNFFDGTYLFTNIFLEQIFEMFYLKRLGYYKLRVFTLIRKAYFKKIKIGIKKFLMEQTIESTKSSKEDQDKLIEDCYAFIYSNMVEDLDLLRIENDKITEELIRDIFDELKVKMCTLETINKLNKEIEEEIKRYDYYSKTPNIEKIIWKEDLTNLKSVLEKHKTFLANTSL